MIKAEEYLKLVHFITNKRYEQLKNKYTYDDLFQVGCVGLVKAVKGFETKFNVKFSTYAFKCIDSQILSFASRDKWFGINRKERFNGNGPCSLNLILKESNRNLELEDTIGNHDVDFEKIELKILIEQLPYKQKYSIKKYYIEGYTQKEIAEKLNCNPRSIGRYINCALSKLREEMVG